MRIFIIISCSFFILHLSALIVNIPLDQSTIQEGINVVSDGDTVLVQPGTYFENINYIGKNITVASLFLTTQDTTYISQTTIDGNQNGNVIIFENEEDSTAVLYGFTITNGNGSTGSIKCSYSNPTLMFLRIMNNNCTGVWFADSNSYLYSLIIYNNVTNYSGGGIYLNHNSDVLIENVLIFENSADFGGGIYCDGGAMPVIINSVISNNTATTSLTTCSGGGILSGLMSMPILINTILSDNLPQQIALNGDDVIIETYILITYSNIMGGIDDISVDTWLCFVLWLEGNIDSDPLFVNPAVNDYHLLNNSPCIGAGVDEIEILTSWHNAPDLDIDGTPRPFPIGSIPDIGAYENQFGEPQAGITNNQLPVLSFQISNYPNPFNPTTTISFSIPEIGIVELSIYNIKGQKIRSLLKDQITAGEHSIVWNGEDNSNKPVSSGIYLYELNVNSKTEAVKKCLLLK